MKENKPPMPGPGDEQTGNHAHLIWYTGAEMSKKLKMHPNTLKYHRMQIHIGHSKIGRKIYYSEHDYQTFLMRFYRGPLVLFAWAFSWLCDGLELVSVV
jgi:hypothetical protein